MSVVAPLFNEAPTLVEFLGRLVKATGTVGTRYEFEFVLRTTEALMAVSSWPRVSSVGSRAAVIELRRASARRRRSGGIGGCERRLIISMDSDLQHFRRTAAVPREQ